MIPLPPCDHDECPKTGCAKPGSVQPDGSTPTATFIAEKSDTKFELTEAEQNYLNNLLLWQEMSAKSTMILGGSEKA